MKREKRKSNNPIKIKGVLANAEPNFSYPDPNVALSIGDDNQDKTKNKDEERINQYQVLLTKLTTCTGALAKSIYFYPEQIDYLKLILERQIPIEIIYNPSSSLISHCPNCGEPIIIKDFLNFCSYCGQALKWVAIKTC